jgi:flagellar motor switch protein FliN/FliY
MTTSAVERFAQVVAEASAARLDGVQLSSEKITATPLAAEISFGRSLPLVAVTLPYAGASTGECVVMLAPEVARALATRLATGFEDADELAEAQLAAIAQAVDSLYGGVTAALAETLDLELTLAPARAVLAADASSLPPVEPDCWVVSYTLEGDGPSLEIVQTVPADLAAALPPSVELALEDDPLTAPGGAGGDSTLLAVERAAAIAADAAAGILSTLFSEELSAATPTVEEHPADALSTFEYPLIVAEVSYLSGLVGSNRFALLPADAAQLAAAMMGTPETTGDGLSAIELSAVSEAMNQVMSATAAELSKALGVEIEVSPPTCAIVEDAVGARASVGDCPYRASFRLVSTIFSAEVVQLVSPELAASLTEAFASFALAQDAPVQDPDGFDAFGDFPLTGFAAALPDPPDPRVGARELLSGIRVRVSAELGRARLPIARVANLPAGSVVVLDRAPADPVDVLVNGTPFAQAKVVLVDGEYAVQILSLSPLDLNA